jgi:hypothetical protein
LKKKQIYARVLGCVFSCFIWSELSFADELDDLKAQLATLQSRVNTLESTPQTVQSTVAGNTVLVRRGRIDMSDWRTSDARSFVPVDRGVTFSVVPSADVAAPVTEISISGYVKSDFIYDFDQNVGDAFGVSNLKPLPRYQQFHSHARQTRLLITSRTATAIGEIRTLIEGDFFGSTECSTSGCLRVRHAWGEWDFLPDWKASIGQYWTNFMPLYALPSTVDFVGPVGLALARQVQFRVTYSSENISAAVALEQPISGNFSGNVNNELEGVNLKNDANVPDLTGSFLYRFEGGHKLGLNAVVGQLGIEGDGAHARLVGRSDHEALWGVIGSAMINFGDVLALTVSGGGGRGAARYIVGRDAASYVGGTVTNPDIKGRNYHHFAASGSAPASPDVTLNAAYGYLKFARSDTFQNQTNVIQTLHANVMWRPVSQMQLGWEVMWARRDIKQSADADAVRGQFGAWYFF